MAKASDAGTAAALIAAWLVFGLISYAPSDLHDSISLVWLPTGMALAAVSVAQRDRVPWLIGASGLAACIYSLAADMRLITALTEGMGEMLAVSAGAFVLKSSRASSDPLRRWVGQVAACAVTAAIGSAAFTLAWIWAGVQLPALRTWAQASIGEWVGALLIVPIILSFSHFKPRRSGGMTMLQFGTGGVAFLGFLIFATLIFQGDAAERYGPTLAPTLTYVPLSLLVLTALLWGERGGGLAVAAGAALMIFWTAFGQGPFAINESFSGEALFEVQIYVGVIAILAGLMLALQERTIRALADTAGWRLRYLQVLESGRFATISIDARSGVCAWSENALSLLGGTPDRDAAALILRADPAVQPMMRAQWEALQSGAIREAEWDWPDGSRASLSALEGPDGRSEVITALFKAGRDR